MRGLLRGVLLAGLVAGAVPAWVLPAGAESFSFGAWGDLPYARNHDAPKMPALIADINRAEIAFSIFDGDIKDSSVACDDAAYAAAIARFDSLKAPVVYVPGDNEWTDCWHLKAGGYDALERLDHLRRTMFARPRSFGRRTLALEQQGAPGAAFSENTRFVHGGIVFLQLNVAGSDNNRVESDALCLAKPKRDLAHCAADNAEFRARTEADIAWLHQGFALARARQAPGLVLTFQADPHFDSVDSDAATFDVPGNQGYPDLIAQLVAEARTYRGQILLIHGDSHYFRLDKPLAAQNDLIANLTRLETFGSPNLHWVRIDVDTATPEVFAVRPQIVAKPPAGN